MEIIITAYDGSIKPITIIDRNTFIKRTGLFPISTIRQQYISRRTYILESLTNLFKFPNKENKEIDLVFRDGITHYNATFKPVPFDIGLFSNDTALMSQLADIYMVRGLLKCTINTGWGTTNVFPIRPIEFDEYKVALTFDNPTTLVEVTQDSLYVYEATRTTFDLFPRPKLYANDDLFPYVDATNLIYDPGTVLNVYSQSTWTHSFNTDSTTLRMNKITINGTGTTVAPFMITNTTKLIYNFKTNEILLNGTKVGTCTGNLPTITTSNYIEFSVVDTDTSAYENIKCSISLRIQGKKTGNIIQ
jgi:hypothetical protein